ncbi:quinon protein alcohol dehydrogenase-like superfamily [Gilbertella persicaria]|uniref:quinon protein alcohol dehydrogenase-like superfamily n=1 Tax=Gilbertella persicaria TaxID=101096 RepID=UPI00221F5E9E|nr:quinon protein alcohol dehydrogenase-like superfamily [Gilbertella persicaria]KAI8070529.1 quinon protein alcohol dehydrogenase-like superfamily [Gilbertella persicaria]
MEERYPTYKSYPPVPNWYSSCITAIIEPHFFLYATRNCIVILGLWDLRYFGSFTVSTEKVTAIAAHETFCFTAGVDKTVRVWNVLLGSLLTSYTEHKAEITALKLIGNGTMVVSTDKSGLVVIADPFNNKKHSQHKVKSEITSLATTTYDQANYLAIGYANGMIFIEKLESDLSTTTVCQIASDNDSIQSLDWQKTTEAWPLLATSTKRKRHVSIWHIPSQSEWTSIRLPNPPAQATEQQKSTVWIELAWSPHEQHKLFFSSFIGSIVCFDLSSKSPKLCNHERLEKHSRNVFTINWFNHGKNCITTSLDKQIIRWDVKKKSCLQSLKTQAGFPYAMDSPAWNPDQLVVGMGDNAIKLWRFADTQTVMKSNKHDYYEATVLWKGLQGKIEKVQCHSTKEGLVAYSNEYGHVGLYDTLDLRRIPCKTYHRSQGAPFIAWGPDMSEVLENNMKDTLFSCGGDGILHVYDANSPQAPPVQLNQRLQEKNLAWFTSLTSIKTNRYSLKIDKKAQYLALGHTNGFVEVYSLQTLKIMYVSNYHRELVRALDFKYINDTVLLASGCDAGDIAIHDIGSIKEPIPDVPVFHSEVMYSLKGHKKGIRVLKWSNHYDKAFLASGSDDSFVVVWHEDKPISSFDRHRNRILSICWSPLDHDILFTGSEDRFIYEWNKHDFPCTEPLNAIKNLYDKEKAILSQNNKRKTEAVPAANVKKPKKLVASNEETDPRLNSMLLSQESEKSTSRLRKEQYCLILADSLIEGKIKQAIHELKGKYLTEEQKKDATVSRYMDFLDEKQQSSTVHENIHELFYGDKNDIRRLIELEVKAIHQKETSSSTEPSYGVHNNVKYDFDIKLAMDIMQCQFSMFESHQLDQNANSCLTDWIVLAMSPMVGKQTWIDLMLKQAQKLEGFKQYHLAASCYIASSHVYEAIELYRRHHMFREAIALAKIRLPPQDPIVSSLFADWANELQKGDQDTLTAIW